MYLGYTPDHSMHKNQIQLSQLKKRIGRNYQHEGTVGLVTRVWITREKYKVNDNS